MSHFDRLHPAIQHHVVNSLGWRLLRPLQEAAIAPILEGRNALLLAPTAGGKTEAALFPLLSRMLSENWQGLSILYICPIKALLNNLEHRLASFAGLLGRRVELWHGDVRDSHRQKIGLSPPDLLLATPESIEVILVSRRIEHRLFFRDLQAVIIDEVHAFAGDDRGWHLLALLERLHFLTGRSIQRIGLSATAGNPADLLHWLSGSAQTPGVVINPPVLDAIKPDVQVDFVGTLGNAAIVIARLHRGEKRLVFCDSRSQVEKLAIELRALGVETHLSHSSLSLEERKRAEAAFVQGQNCVIVATSTLELGIDVGDLDRVIQLDAPHTVASFLQRIGRTGRRSGSSRNCLFLATTEDAFLRAMGLMRLWVDGYVEPILPPLLPFHILAQQIMALALQESGIGRQEWLQHLGGMPGFATMEASDREEIVCFMLAQGILFEDGGLLMMGDDGAARFGRRHFMELMSVFTSPPLFTILHGRTEIGQVHQHSFVTHADGPAILALAGQNWRVAHIDWNRHEAFVEPSSEPGKSRWLGDGQPMHFDLCQAIVRVLREEEPFVRVSARGMALWENLRESFAWLDTDKTFLIAQRDQEIRWWNFAGGRFNTQMAACLTGKGFKTSQDNFSTAVQSIDLQAVKGALRECLEQGDKPMADATGAEGDGLKFSQCLPPSLIKKLFAKRLGVAHAVEVMTRREMREVREY